MIWFTRDQKELARRSSEEALQRGYANTEKRLKAAAAVGNKRAMSAAMKAHHRYEYALLHKSYAKSRKHK